LLKVLIYFYRLSPLRYTRNKFEFGGPRRTPGARRHRALSPPGERRYVHSGLESLGLLL